MTFNTQKTPVHLAETDQQENSLTLSIRFYTPAPNNTTDKSELFMHTESNLS